MLSCPLMEITYRADVKTETCRTPSAQGHTNRRKKREKILENVLEKTVEENMRPLVWLAD